MALNEAVPMGEHTLRRRNRERQDQPNDAHLQPEMARVRRPRHPQPRGPQADRPVRQERHRAIQAHARRPLRRVARASTEREGEGVWEGGYAEVGGSPVVEGRGAGSI